MYIQTSWGASRSGEEPENLEFLADAAGLSPENNAWTGKTQVLRKRWYEHPPVWANDMSYFLCFLPPIPTLYFHNLTCSNTEVLIWVGTQLRNLAYHNDWLNKKLMRGWREMGKGSPITGKYGQLGFHTKPPMMVVVLQSPSQIPPSQDFQQ